MNTESHIPPFADTAAGLDLAALADWLAPRLGQSLAGLAAERLSGGQSNPSWKLTAGEQAWALRAKPGPAAHLLPSAHAIEREFRVLQALAGSAVPVPSARLLCEDEAVMGAAFYVMDWVDGRVLRDARLPALPVAERAAYHHEAVRVLAELHRVDWRGRGLSDFGRHGGYFARLIQRWGRQAQAGAGEAPAALRALMAWLPAHIPPGADDEGTVCLTHGDYRLENLMFHPHRPEVVAVLDWELATLGHPLGDLAYHCMAWRLPVGVLRGLAGTDLAAGGLPGETDQVRRYCALSGRDPDAVLAHWPFYLAFNLFRLAAILLGIAVRVREGTAAHPNAAGIARMATPVAELGWAIARGAVHETLTT